VLVWSLVAAAVVAIGLGATATLVLVRATSTEIPRVTEISATAEGSSVVFTWSDPGLRSGDAYIISTGSDTSQQTSNRFVASASDTGEQLCITVSVNRAGQSGEPSGEQCAVAGGGE
jgi:hypothetical protein